MFFGKLGIWLMLKFMKLCESGLLVREFISLMLLKVKINFCKGVILRLYGWLEVFSFREFKLRFGLIGFLIIMVNVVFVFVF